MLFNTLTYAIFFALVFGALQALAPGRSKALRGVTLALLALGAAYAASLGEFTLAFTAAAGAGAVLASVLRASPVASRTALLLLVSYGFYAAWDWRYLPLIFGSSTVDYFLARAIAREELPRRRKAWLAVTVALNLGFLGFFKYWNFGLENFAFVTELMLGNAPAFASAESLKVLLPPVGISFFTFESMSYVIDVYRRELEPHESYFRYLLFVSFFPHLVAGPIVRPRDLLPQLEREPGITREQGGEAMFLVAVGLLKKVVIADQLAVNLVDRVFERPESFSSLEVLAGIYGYAVQIYCDFSGYTDIAIGSALLLGVRFPLNFNAPYKARNIADFWRRWHISLSTWLRDYLYIPLGGNRGSELSTYRNLILTMLLGGLWHGAAWTFVFWGFLHGAALAVTRAFQRFNARRKGRFEPKEDAGVRGAPLGAEARPSALSALGAVLGVFFTFHVVCLAWVFFRATSFGGAVRVLRQLAELTTFTPNLPPLLAALLGVGLLSHYVPERAFAWMRSRFARLPAPAQGLLLFLVAALLHEAASAKAVPFVYFQF